MWIIIEAKVASANPHPPIVQQLSLNVPRNRIATAVIGRGKMGRDIRNVRRGSK